MRMKLVKGPQGLYFELLPVHRNGKPVRDVKPLYFDSDWNYPALAQAFGWSLVDVQRSSERCDHSGDGTVKCARCGLDASDFISAAYDYLDRNDGKTVEDVVGYFDN